MSLSTKFAVIGLGRFGLHLARTLAAAGADVIAIDRHVKQVEQARDSVTLAVRLDGTDEEALKAQGIHEVDVAIVGIGDDLESAAVTVATLKELGVPRIISRAENEMQARILKRIGATETVAPENESALRWAHRLMMPNLKQYIELDEEHSIVYLPAPESFHEKTLLELDMRNQFGVNLIAIERPVSAGDEGGALKMKFHVPNAVMKILPGDVLIVVGADASLMALPSAGSS